MYRVQDAITPVFPLRASRYETKTGRWSLCVAIFYCAVQYGGIYGGAYPPTGGAHKSEVNEMSDVQKYSEEFQEAGKVGFDAAVNSLGEVNKGLQAIAAEVPTIRKSRLRTAPGLSEQPVGAKSFEHVMEIQSQYARMAYEAYVAELTKLGNMYAGLTRTAFKPVEQAAAKVGSPNRLRSA